MLINVGYDMAIEVASATTVHLITDVHASRQRDIAFEDPVNVGGLPLRRSFDIFGNLVQRFQAQPGITTMSYRAVVRDDGLADKRPLTATEVPILELPDECLTYLNGSRYCETDELSSIAWQNFGHVPPGFARVQAICDFVHNHIRFDYQNARSNRTALGALNDGTGVCRDFAHLAVAFCRCLNIPARYVNGYLGDIGVPVDPAPMDFSAWFEAYIGDEWVTFDARHNKPRIGRIVIARGRDAADVPMITTYGLHRLVSFKVVAEPVVPVETPAEKLVSKSPSATVTQARRAA